MRLYFLLIIPLIAAFSGQNDKLPEFKLQELFVVADSNIAFVTPFLSKKGLSFVRKKEEYGILSYNFAYDYNKTLNTAKLWLAKYENRGAELQVSNKARLSQIEKELALVTGETSFKDNSYEVKYQYQKHRIIISYDDVSPKYNVSIYPLN